VSRAPDIWAARVHNAPNAVASARLLVDRVWPRGIAKADLRLDEWIRDVAPSIEFRKWFGHDPEKWQELQGRYRAELDDNPEAVDRCLGWCRKGPVTLLFAAKDREHNQAVVLREHLIERAPREEEGHGPTG
jgi:uncharacterized protein YeaO (DUF488 family)